MGVVVLGTLLFWVYIRAPDVWKLTFTICGFSRGLACPLTMPISKPRDNPSTPTDYSEGQEA